jgi:N-methylhydantoinase A
MYRIGIDVGGTFTDVVLVDEDTGANQVAKVLNEPGRKAETVVRGILDVLKSARVSVDQVRLIAHGTTIATNAVLERKGARVALITNSGFRDVLEIGRFSRPPDLIYRVQADRPPPLVPRHLRLELDCRLDSEGHELRPVSLEDVDKLIARLKQEKVEAVAVCLLFSFLNPRQEQLVGHRLSAELPGVHVLLSSAIQPEFREFPRASTTVFAAAVSPIIGNYLDGLQSQLAKNAIKSPLYVFQSNGGVAEPQIVRRRPSTLFLSGPAGAVIGAAQLAKESPYRNMITIDMGGTSLDVCLLRDGVAGTTGSREIDYFPLLAPMLDVHTVGAGGGSLCRLDEVGRVKVGPESASSDPGPACYGRGGAGLTLTDINLVLGYLDPAEFAGGSVPLFADKAHTALQDAIASPLKMGAIDAAAGVWKVAASQMAEAIRYITVQRGVDPREFDLVAFGGGGPLHAYGIADEIGIRRIIIPVDPGLFSAQGIALADFTHDYVASVVRSVDRIQVGDLESLLAGLRARAEADLKSEGVEPAAQALQVSLDARYLGQSTEINVQLPSEESGTGIDLKRYVSAFHRRHEELYTYSVPGEPVEIVNLRLRAVGRMTQPSFAKVPAKQTGPAKAKRRAWFPKTGLIETPVWDRHDIGTDARLRGPLLVQEMSSTTVVPPDAIVTMDGGGNLIVSLHQSD